VLKEKGVRQSRFFERHHRFKKDSPSGTALHFARIVQEAMGQTELRHGARAWWARDSRTRSAFHAIRVGDNGGEHTILFSTLGETLELTHRAHTRDCYARGAVQAAKFSPAGRRTLHDERRAGAMRKLFRLVASSATRAPRG